MIRNVLLSVVSVLALSSAAVAAPVMSKGGIVMSAAGPVISGGALVEQSEGSYLDVTPAKPAVTEERQCERTITKYAHSIKEAKSLLHKGYSWAGGLKFTKTVVHTKTVEIEPAQPKKVKRVRNNAGGGGNADGSGRQGGDGGARGHAGQGG